MDPVVAEAQHVLAWITRSKTASFTRRELFEGTKGRFKQVGALALPLDLLVRHGYIRERAPEPRPGPGRKPSPTYDVNPLIASQNSRNSQKPASGSDNGPPKINSANSANSANAIAPEEQSGTPLPPAEQVEFEEGVI
jgi:hypothetical protein